MASEVPPSDAEVTVVTRQQMLDELFTAASVLKGLKPMEKIRVGSRHSLLIEVQSSIPVFPLRWLRFLTGQSADVTLEALNAIYCAFWSQMTECVDLFKASRMNYPGRDRVSMQAIEDEHFRQLQLLKRLRSEARASLAGLRTLLITYRESSQFVASVKVLLQNVQDKLAQMDRDVNTTFGGGCIGIPCNSTLPSSTDASVASAASNAAVQTHTPMAPLASTSTSIVVPTAPPAPPVTASVAGPPPSTPAPFPLWASKVNSGMTTAQIPPGGSVGSKTGGGGAL
jgi:hypothetical protein